MTKLLILLLVFPNITAGNLLFFDQDNEDQRIDLLIDLVTRNLKTNGWKNIIIFGTFPNYFYMNLKLNDFTFVISNTNDADYYIEDTVPYHSNTIIINCLNFGHFEESLLQVMSLAYWHPHANIFVYYHKRERNEDLARFFFIFWYYRSFNVIFVQYDDTKEILLTSHFSPFVSDGYDFENKYGCFTVRKIGMPLDTFEESFICEKNCHNVSLNSRLRRSNLGTCIGFVTHSIPYSEQNTILNLTLFEDKGKNFHGFTFSAFITEVLPFMVIQEYGNNSYKLSSRDGMIWNTLTDLMNFTIDLTPSINVLKTRFDFEISIQQIFAMAHRKGGDLFLMPIYQFDVIVVEIDYTYAFKESGVCFMAHRAGFETVLFDLNTLTKNYDTVIKFGVSFFCIWFVFCLYSGIERKQITMDFFGKNLMNSVRSILLISLLHPPKRTSFRLFLTIIIWSFFIINFATQAAIISFFTAFKRGPEVNTFDDIVEKGYNIEGMASPDIVLPETEERFLKINSKLTPIRDIFGCVKDMDIDSHRFCLIDCAVGRYLQRNKLNKKGEQYVYIAKDRVHSHYLNFIFPKYSVFTENINKHVASLFEAGLIKKWEEYRYNDIKEEAPIKPLGLSDAKGVFHLYVALIIITVLVFFIEISIGNYQKIKAIVV